MTLDEALHLGLTWNLDMCLRMESANSQVNTPVGLAKNVLFTFAEGFIIYLQVHIFVKPAYTVLLGHPFDTLTESNIQNFQDGSAIITIRDPNTGCWTALPILQRGKMPKVGVGGDQEKTFSVDGLSRRFKQPGDEEYLSVNSELVDNPKTMHFEYPAKTNNKPGWEDWEPLALEEFADQINTRGGYLHIVATEVSDFEQELIHIDTMHMTSASNGCKYIVHSRCALSSWMEGQPLHKENHETIGQWLFEDVICHWGCIAEIITNNAGQSKKVTAWIESKYGIRSRLLC
ncbi:hypothetical protein J132_07434 [Termitomyces sp. J132]|nr:hypothetical protein J132_07434 [Termitomyces sp. J132]